MPAEVYTRRNDWVDHNNVTNNGFPKCELVNSPEVKGMPDVPKPYSIVIEPKSMLEILLGL